MPPLPITRQADTPKSLQVTGRQLTDDANEYAGSRALGGSVGGSGFCLFEVLSRKSMTSSRHEDSLDRPTIQFGGLALLSLSPQSFLPLQFVSIPTTVYHVVLPRPYSLQRRRLW